MSTRATQQERPTKQTRSSRFYQAGRSRDGSGDVPGGYRDGGRHKDMHPPQRRNVKDALGGSSKKNGRKEKGGQPREAAPISSVGFSSSSTSSQPSCSSEQLRRPLVEREAAGDEVRGERGPGATSTQDVTMNHHHVGQNLGRDASTERRDSTIAIPAPPAAVTAAAPQAPSSAVAAQALSFASPPAKAQPSPAKPDSVRHSSVRTMPIDENTSENVARATSSDRRTDQQEVRRSPRPSTQATAQQSDEGSKNEGNGDKNVHRASREKPRKNQQQRQYKSRSKKTGHQKIQQQQKQQGPKEEEDTHGQQQHRHKQQQQQHHHHHHQPQHHGEAGSVSSAADIGSAVCTSRTSSFGSGLTTPPEGQVPNAIEDGAAAAADQKQENVPRMHELSASEPTDNDEHLSPPGNDVGKESSEATESIASRRSSPPDVLPEKERSPSNEPPRTSLPAEGEALGIATPVAAEARSTVSLDNEPISEQQQQQRPQQNKGGQQKKRREGLEPQRQPTQLNLQEATRNKGRGPPVSEVDPARRDVRATDGKSLGGEKNGKGENDEETHETARAVATNAATEEDKEPENRSLGPGLILESVEVAGGIAQWAAEHSRGGEFSALLETVRRDSGAASVDTRVVLKNGKGHGGRAQMEKIHVDVRASTPAKARVARALLVTHLKSRSELLRLEQRRKSIEGSLSAFEREVSEGLRVQFATRTEWIGLLVGKAGARIRDIRQATGCSIEVVDGRGGGGGGGGHRGGGNADRGHRDRDHGGAAFLAGGVAGSAGSDGRVGASSSCRVVISGPAAENVQDAREQMELVEIRVPVDARQAAILGRLPRTKLQDLRQQSECLVVDLQSFPSPSVEGRRDTISNTTRNIPSTTTTSVVRVIGPRATVDSARMILGVILEYVDREREMREGDTAVRERLSNMQASFGHPGMAGAVESRRGGRGGTGGRGRGGRGGKGEAGRGGGGGGRKRTAALQPSGAAPDGST